MVELDGYADIERIGHGGLGDVYRATRASTGSTVAIKVLRDVSDESIAWNRTRRELTALVSLGGHAHVIRLLEVLEEVPGLVMEYAPGGSVAQLLDHRGGTLSVAEAVLVGRQTASALAAAHEQGIVHRDVKPQNLLIDAYGQVKLCDFGIASLARTEEFRTRTSAISMRYASPEDLEDDAEVGPASDLYSLGATLLHLVHGAPPALRDRLAAWTPPPADDGELAALDEILAACLRPEPDRRPTAGEVLERFERLDWELHDRRRALDVVAGGAAAAAAPLRAPVDVQIRDAHPDAAPPPDVDAATDASPLASDATLYRTGRTPVAPARPAPTRRRRVPWASILGVLGLAIAVTAAWIVLAGRTADAPTEPIGATTSTAASETTVAPVDDAAPALSVVERPDGLIPLDDPSLTWPFGEVGDCLVQVAGDATLRVIDCDQPHDLERFAAGEIGADIPIAPGPYDATAVNAAIDASCADALARFETTVDGTGVRIAQTRPTAESWAAGDRSYQCLLGVPGSRLVGAATD